MKRYVRVAGMSPVLIANTGVMFCYIPKKTGTLILKIKRKRWIGQSCAAEENATILPDQLKNAKLNFVRFI